MSDGGTVVSVTFLEDDIKYYGKVCIPSTVVYDNVEYSVVEIGNNAFNKCSELTSITIPESIIKICENAFSGCTNLTSITIPNSVTYIGDAAFAGCSNLTSITIPNSVTSIGYYAFDGCSGVTSFYMLSNNFFNYDDKLIEDIGEYSIEDYDELSRMESLFIQIMCMREIFRGLNDIDTLYWNSNITPRVITGYCSSHLRHVTIGNDVTRIGYQAFQKCSLLTSISIPEGVTNIFNKAFSECKGLTSIVLPNGVKFIGDYAFSECSKLSMISIPNSVNRIGKGAFLCCLSLTSVTIPMSVTIIGDYAFQGTGLTSVMIPAGVIHIGSYAFSYCDSLTSVNISESVSTIENNMFLFCYNLTSIIIDSNNTVYDSRDGCNAIIESSTNKLILGCKETIIPSGVTTIGELAFNSCKDLISISIPESIKTIEKYAFSYCTSLTSLIIPEGVMCIGDSAFYNCKDLAVLSIPGSLTNVGQNAFYGCNNIESLMWSSTLSPSCVSQQCNKNLKYVVLNNIISIEKDFFSGCSKIKSLKIPESVVSIENEAFKDCILIDTLYWGSNVSAYAVSQYCRGNLKCVILGDITTIGNSAFYGCTGLKSITIPKSVTSIGDRAFEKCTDLVEVVVCGTPEIGLNSFMHSGIEQINCRSLIPCEMKLNYPFVCGDYDNIKILDGTKTPVYDINMHKTVTEVNCQASEIDAYNIPSGKYKFSVGILPSPDSLPNIFHARIDAYINDGEVITLLDSVIFSEVEIHGDIFTIASPHCLINNPVGYNLLTIVDTLFLPDSCLHISINIISQVDMLNADIYTNRMILDRIYIEPLDELPSPQSYSGPFTESVFNSATLYVPEEAVEAYRAADGWKLFRNIVADETVYPADEVEVTISGAGYATFYYSDGDYVLPEGLSAMVVSGMFNDKLVYEIIARGSDGGVIPAGVPVVLVSDNNKAGVYKLSLTYGVFEFNGLNLLIGSDKDTQTYAESSSRFYKLAYGPSGTDLSDVLGWYWGAADGGAFNIEAHKAWLALPKATTKGMAGFTLSGDATFVIDIESDKDDEMIIYDIYGRKLSVPTGSGMYIINGKEVVITK